jgi:hypothetical protein
MEFIGQFAILSEFILFPILILSIFYLIFIHPFVIQKRFTKIPDFVAGARHIGVLSGIAIDFSQRKLAYIDRFRVRTFSATDIYFDGSGHQWVEVFDEHGNRREKNHEAKLLTDRADCPEIRVAFWLRTQAQRCMISVRRLAQAQRDYECEIAADRKAITPQEQDLEAGRLTAFLDSQGFSRADAEESVKNRRICEAIELLYREFYDGRPQPHGWQETIARGLEPVFLRNEGEPKSVGHTEKTLRKYVSDTIRDIENSDKNRRKNNG